MRSSSVALVTGFEPFDGDESNPSGDAVRALAGRWCGPERLVTAVLPVAFAAACSQLADLLAEHRPDVVLAAGLAGNREVVTVERVALNLLDARIPDNDGAMPAGDPSLPGAPDGLFATLPVKAIVDRLQASGIRVVVALDATRTFDLTGPDGSVITAPELMRVTATNLHGGSIRPGAQHRRGARRDCP